MEENQIWRGSAEEMARAPLVAGERWQRRLGTLGRGRKGTARKGSPTPPFYTQPTSRPDIPAKVGPDYPPPGYSTHGGGYSGLERQKVVPLKFSKIEVFFDEKFELVCIERML
jgi:hypothetical protein